MRHLLFIYFVLPLTLIAQQTPLNFLGEVSGERNEVSGMVVLPGMSQILMIEDSGNEPALALIDYAGGFVSGVTLDNLRNRDWEDLQTDQNGFLYIGDIGNNFSDRDTMVIYRLENVAGFFESNLTLSFDSIQFTYSDQLAEMQLNPSGNFDCEAFVVDDEVIHLYSKDHSGRNYTKHYVLPNEMGRQTAQLIDSTQLTSWVTGAHLRHDCSQLYLCSDNRLTTFTDFSLEKIYEEYTFDTQQVESIFKDNQGRVLLVEEAEIGGGSSRLYSFHEREREPQIRLFPNPAFHTISLRFAVPVHSISVYQSSGKRVFEAVLEIDCNAYNLDVNSFIEGRYIVFAASSGDPVIGSFIKLD